MLVNFSFNLFYEYQALSRKYINSFMRLSKRVRYLVLDKFTLHLFVFRVIFLMYIYLLAATFL